MTVDEEFSALVYELLEEIVKVCRGKDARVISCALVNYLSAVTVLAELDPEEACQALALNLHHRLQGEEVMQ
jgi:hypothetical protein